MLGSLQAWLRRRFIRRPLPLPPSDPPRPVAPPVFLAEDPADGVDAWIVETERRGAHTDARQRLAEGNNRFACALYAQLRQEGTNQIFCPLSISMALLMAYCGARGETAAQIRTALRVSVPDEELYATWGELTRRPHGKPGAYELTLANAVWIQRGAPLEPVFRDAIARHFDATWNTADFKSGSVAARSAINSWVSEQTRGRITSLLGPQSLAPDTRLALVNAAYFKGSWWSPFRRGKTRDGTFFLADGGRVRVPLMHTIVRAGYFRDPHYQAVTLQYLDPRMCMLLLVPERTDGLAALEATLSVAMIRQCLERGGSEVDLVMPRFTVEWGTAELSGALAELGIREAFTRGAADFSGINGRVPPDPESLCISSVYHKAFVEVNEEGTEAAAASATEMLCAGLPPEPQAVPVVRADHPFLFAICDRPSGAVVFLGRVLNPAQDN